jgi:hypothetical protein
MRIAQVALLYASVLPPAVRGTERIVSYLTEELVRMGHDVTLVPVWPRALCPGSAWERTAFQALPGGRKTAART